MFRITRTNSPSLVNDFAKSLAKSLGTAFRVTNPFESNDEASEVRKYTRARATSWIPDITIKGPRGKTVEIEIKGSNSKYDLPLTLFSSVIDTTKKHPNVIYISVSKVPALMKRKFREHHITMLELNEQSPGETATEVRKVLSSNPKFSIHEKSHA